MSAPVSKKTTLVQNALPFYDWARVYGDRKKELADTVPPRTLADLLFGNPQELPSPDMISALKKACEPQHPQWFAYTGPGEDEQRAYVAKDLQKVTGLPYAGKHVLLTTGAFTALQTCYSVVLDPGDEVIYTTPNWFFYKSFALLHDATTKAVSLDLTDGSLDLDAIQQALTPKTRLLVLNLPKNPTGRIYTEQELTKLGEMLSRQSKLNGRVIYLLSDEPYRRVVFEGTKFVPPAAFYDNTFISYSWGKQLLNPGQRLGYVAASPKMAQVDIVLNGLYYMIAVGNHAYPNAVMQYALMELDKLSIDVGAIERRAKKVCAALDKLECRYIKPSATFYVFIKAPIEDSKAFGLELLKHDVAVLPGIYVETEGWFRLSLTATDDMVSRALEVLSRAFTDWDAFIAQKSKA